MNTSRYTLHKILIIIAQLMLLNACSYFPIEDNQHIEPYQNVQLTPALPEEQWLDVDPSTLPLSVGDRVKILVEDGTAFSGVFEVNVDGRLHIPYLDAIRVAGISAPQAQQKLIDILVKQKMYQPGFNRVSVKILQWAKIQIFVQGAVFNPGRVLLNDKSVAQQTYKDTQESGDNPVKRYLTAGLKGAGGVRPDADLAHVSIIRQERVITLNLSGIFNGFPVQDVPLIAGDRLIIPSLGKLQTALMRPSQITPIGFQVFMSNLSQPSVGNAQASISKSSRSVPYGTRLLEGAMAANCMGGSWINSSRKIVHSSNDRRTNKPFVQVFNLEEVVSNADQINKNPYLMPNDGLACFDSDATNVREVAKFLKDILDPVAIAKLIFLF